jgi:CrcB protein
MNVLLVGAGGFFGAMARFFVSKWFAGRFQSAIPYGTLSINLAGSFLLGLMAGAEPWNAVRLLIGTGFLGAFTTFSTFKVESVRLWAEKRYLAFWAYIGLSYTAGIALAFAGFWLGESLR